MVFCQCGLESEYDKFGMLNAVRRSGADQKSSERLSYTVHQLDRLQRKGLEDLCKTAGGCSLFEDSVTESFVDENHQAAESRNIVLKGYTDRFTAGDDSVPFEKITGISINRRNLLLVHVADMPGHLEFKGPGSFNALKYLYLYRSVCGSRNGLL